MHPLQNYLGRTHSRSYCNPAWMLGWIIVASQIDPISHSQVVYRDDVPYTRYSDCSAIARQMNIGFLKANEVGLAHCEPR